MNVCVYAIVELEKKKHIRLNESSKYLKKCLVILIHTHGCNLAIADLPAKGNPKLNFACKVVIINLILPAETQSEERYINAMLKVPLSHRLLDLVMLESDNLISSKLKMKHDLRETKAIS